jgi:hypothetical protein
MRSGEQCVLSNAMIFHLKMLRSFAGVLILLGSTVICEAQTRRGPVFTITSVQALLFYDNSGAFSEDVADDISDNVVVPSILWNTPIEGASRKGASTSVLIKVEVSGKDAAHLNRSIELTLKYKPLERSKEIVQRRVRPIRMGEDGKFIAGFWVDEVGCNPVVLTARVTGQTRSTVKKIIRFGCGE